MNVSKEKRLYLKDKLQGWPDAMCLTSKDIADLIGLIESSGEKRKPGTLGYHDVDEFYPGPAPSPGLSAPLPAEVEEAMDTLHEAAYDGLCYKYHAKDKVEWWDAVLKAEAIIKSALGPAPPSGEREEMVHLMDKIERKLALPQGKAIARKIRALILAPPIRVTREWIGKLIHEGYLCGAYNDNQERFVSMLREKGIEVEEKG